MKTKVLFTILLAGAMIVPIVFASQSESNDQLKNFYKACLEKKILSCQSKTMLNSSKSANLRKTSAMASEQALFYSSNKEILVNEMIELEIGQKPYKVNYFLIKRYHEKAK